MEMETEMEIDSEGQSQDTTRSSMMDLNPTRRHNNPSKMTDTSKSFMHSNRPENENEEQEATANRKRQMKLDFSGGSMGTKKPLNNPIKPNDARRKALAKLAEETLLLLPGLLATRPDVTSDGFLCQKETLDSKYQPHLPLVTVQVVDMDTIDLALQLHSMRSTKNNGKPVAILNMASASHAGGGFKRGALAQEEALCYRSSLSLTLKQKYYPIPDDAAIYSPSVMLIRDSMANGHKLLDFRDPRRLSVISVISCAAICKPSLTKTPAGNLTYALNKDRRVMMEKLRIILRTAIRNRHRQIVLGALGCGVFGNPNHEVAAMWKEVLLEQEFSGGWWENVVFAVMGGNAGANSNYQVFHDELDGFQLR